MRDKNRRVSLRIPLNCKTKIKVLGTRESYYGICRDLSVDGILIESEYVPRYGQVLEISVLPPQQGPVVPLNAVIQVRRCTEVVGGSGKDKYESEAAKREIGWRPGCV